jgi:hypothetical protein
MRWKFVNREGSLDRLSEPQNKSALEPLVFLRFQSQCGDSKPQQLYLSERRAPKARNFLRKDRRYMTANFDVDLNQEQRGSMLARQRGTHRPDVLEAKGWFGVAEFHKHQARSLPSLRIPNSTS